MLLSEEGGKILNEILREVDTNSKDLRHILRNKFHSYFISQQVKNTTIQSIISTLRDKDTIEVNGNNISSIKNDLIEAISSVSNEFEGDLVNLNKLVKQEASETPVNVCSFKNPSTIKNFNTRLSSIVSNMDNNNEYPFLNMKENSPHKVSYHVL